jgi:heptosyltransferase I
MQSAHNSNNNNNKKIKVLIVKTSSMGDIIHTLPALSDVVQSSQSMQQAEIDWVVEEGFREIPQWHFGVNNVIPVAWRRWRKNLAQAFRSGEIPRFIKVLSAKRYDYIIDAQGLLKSALILLFAHGKSYGYAWSSAREPLAALFYRKRIKVSQDQHAVTRIRQLFATVFGYTNITSFPYYGIDKNRLPKYELLENSLLFIHGTSREDKCWPEPKWIALAKLVNGAGLKVLLPWGNSVELERAKRIAASSANGEVLPKLKLSELAALLGNVKGAVAVDTGLGHLAAALDVPTVSLYGDTSPKLIGTYGRNQTHIQNFLNVSPQDVMNCF